MKALTTLSVNNSPVALTVLSLPLIIFRYTTNCSIRLNVKSEQRNVKRFGVDQGSPTFLKVRATSCVPINAKGN